MRVLSAKAAPAESAGAVGVQTSGVTTKVSHDPCMFLLIDMDVNDAGSGRNLA
jgi:hypothetical protein